MVLEQHGFIVQRDQVIDAVRTPDRIVHGQGLRQIAERQVSERHKLRVVFETERDNILIITFYPRMVNE